MPVRQGLRARIDRFAGLSDRRIPTKLSRIECPRLMNVDFSERIAKKRLGFSRLHTGCLKNASARFKPRIDATVAVENSYGRISYRSAYNSSGAGNANFVSVVCALRDRPTAAATVVQKGYGAVANMQFRIYYDPTLNANAGGWTGTMYDSGAAALRTMSVNDGDGIHCPPPRYLQLGYNSAGAMALQVWDVATGATVGTTTAAWTGPGVSVTEDITVGVGMSASNTIGTDWINASICEFRVGVGTSATTSLYATSSNTRYGRELTPAETALFKGYWKLNDGSSNGKFADSTSALNDGYFPRTPPAWTTDSTKCLGQSGLRFNNGDHWAHLYVAAGTSAYGTVFTGTVPRWTLRGTFAPEAATGSATYPDQTLLWSGTGGAIPAPVGIRIVGDQFIGYYRDGANTRTPSPTIPGGVSSLVGKKIRWALYRYGAGNGSVTMSVGFESSPGVMTTYNNTVACTAAAAGVVADDWCLGRHVTAYATQTTGTFGTFTAADGQCLGTIDDLQLIWTNSTSGWVGLGNVAPGPLYAMNEVSSWQALSGTHQTIWYFNLNEGAGSTFTATSNFLTGTTYAGALYPIQHDGILWGDGLVEPYLAPRIRGIYDFKRFLTDGTPRRSCLAVCGSTLYDIDTTSNTATPVAAGIHQSNGLVTFAQYGQRVFIAEANGQRPMVWDGQTLRWMGIVAPTAPIGQVVLAAGGAFVAGAYYLYYTFRNTVTGEESNPSRGVLINPALNNKIDSLAIQTSPDPQVDQRRIYITGVGGADGSVAYLVTTINDNVTTNWTTDITAGVTSGISISTTSGYLDRKEPPQGSLVGIHKDFAFVGGNQKYPTRLWRSAVGQPGAFQYTDSTGLYVDLDLDSGDIITSMFRTNDYLMVGIRDGTARVWSTGDTNNPIQFDFLPVQHGPVGPQTWTEADGTFFYITERDIFRMDGQNEVNISSPPTEGYPSVQYFLRNSVNPATRYLYCAATLRSKNQAWFGFASQGTLIYDYSQGIFSLYDIYPDVLAEVEDNNDTPSVFAGIQGFVCKMEAQAYDGISVARSGSVSASAASTLQTTDSIGSIARGHRIHTYDPVTETVATWTVYSVTSGSPNTITFYESGTPAVNAKWCCGGVPFFMEFVVDFGDPMSGKLLRWIRLLGTSDSDLNFARIVYKGDASTRVVSMANGRFHNQQWLADENFKLINIGGLFTNARFLIGDTGFSANKGADAYPNMNGYIDIHAVEFEADSLDDLP